MGKKGKAPASGERKAPASGENRKGKGKGSKDEAPRTLWGAGAAVAVLVVAWLATREGAPPPLGDGPAGDLLRLAQATPNVKLEVYDKIFDGIGRGLAAARSFPADSAVIEMPVDESCFIGKHNLPMTFGFAAAKGGVLEGGQGAKQEAVLAVMLERQKPDSKWRPFFETLPRRIENLAVMKDVHRRALNSTDLVKKFADFDELYVATSDFVKKNRALFSPVPLDDEVRWAVAVIESRAHMHSRGEERIIWPFIVLSNHHWDQDLTLDYVTVPPGPGTKNGAVQLRTRRPLKQGEQIFLHYGRHSNTRLLVQYGFTIPSNPVLDPTPISMLTVAGADLFKFQDGLTSAGGPACKDLARRAQETLSRNINQPAGLPELLLNCWRLMKFEDVPSALRAVEAGMFSEGGGDAHFGFQPPLPLEWLERDALTYDGIAAACVDIREGYTKDGGAALRELSALNDTLSQNLHAALSAEIKSWDLCVNEMRVRAGRIREHMAGRTAA